MQPLQCENTILEFLRARIFMIFLYIFKTNSRTNLLSIFCRFLMALWFHFGTILDNILQLFWPSFSSTKNMKRSDWLWNPVEGILDTSQIRGELGGIWEPSGRPLGASGKPLGSIWEAGVAKRGLDQKACILYVFSQQKWRDRAPRLDETRVGVTKYHACAQKLSRTRSAVGEILRH